MIKNEELVLVSELQEEVISPIVARVRNGRVVHSMSTPDGVVYGVLMQTEQGQVVSYHHEREVKSSDTDHTRTATRVGNHLKGLRTKLGKSVKEAKDGDVFIYMREHDVRYDVCFQLVTFEQKIFLGGIKEITSPAPSHVYGMDELEDLEWLMVEVNGHASVAPIEGVV